MAKTTVAITEVTMARKKNLRNKASIFFVVICVIVIATCMGYISWYMVHQKNKKNTYEQLASEVRVSEHASNTIETTDTPQEKLVIPIDFVTLQQKNSDIYAWISIPGMDIEYPVCQSATDDSYYLDYSVDGTYGLPGSIYTESMNAKDFSDFNTVIYGHEMKNGSMFGTLKKYRDVNFMNEHSQILIYTPDSILTYEVFAAVTYSDRHILKSYDWSNVDQRQTYLNSIYGIRDLNSPIREDVQVDTNSRLLTLRDRKSVV